MKRFGYGLEFGLTIFHTNAAAPVEEGFTWGDHSEHATLSNGNLTVSTAQGAFYANARSSVLITGKKAIKWTPVYPGAAESTEATLGIVSASFNVSDEANQPGFEPLSWGYLATGEANFENAPGPSLAPWASGDPVYCYLDIPDGKGWFDTAADATATDREAGTNPHFTFPGGTPLYAVASLYSSDDASTVSATLIPTYSSGTYEALNS